MHFATAPSLPYSLEAEKTVLGALLVDPEKMVDIDPLLRAEDFYDPTYRIVYDAIARLHGQHKAVDYVTVTNELSGNERIEQLGGGAFVAELTADVPTSSHAESYARIVQEKALKRRLAQFGATVAATAANAEMSAADALEQAEQQLLALAPHTTESGPQHIADLGADSYERYTQLYEADDASAHFGVTTGFAQLDHLLTGLSPGQLMILAARPSMGKTALALDIARHAASQQGKRVTIFSLEMTKQEIMDRIIAGFLGVDTWKLKKGDMTEADFQRIGTLLDQLRDYPIHIDDDPDRTLANLRSKARRQQLQHGVDLLIVDYLQLVEVTDKVAGENQTQRVSYISSRLKNLARELSCPIIALSQLSRSCEQRTPKIPILSDLRDSGSIEQDADSVLMLYREGYYEEDCEDPHVTDVFVRKNRNGPTGRVELTFVKEKMSFRSLA